MVMKLVVTDNQTLPQNAVRSGLPWENEVVKAFQALIENLKQFVLSHRVAFAQRVIKTSHDKPLVNPKTLPENNTSHQGALVKNEER